MNPQHIPTDLFLLYDKHMQILQGEGSYSAFWGMLTYMSKVRLGLLTLLTIYTLTFTGIGGLSSIKGIIRDVQNNGKIDIYHFVILLASLVLLLFTLKLFHL
jgi:hypothetical protein